ncbi:unnamed protein product [Owenia fusiformis]|nr:unnamed protein product [Owenia fusiformis]
MSLSPQMKLKRLGYLAVALVTGIFFFGMKRMKSKMKLISYKGPPKRYTVHLLSVTITQEDYTLKLTDAQGHCILNVKLGTSIPRGIMFTATERDGTLEITWPEVATVEIVSTLDGDFTVYEIHWKGMDSTCSLSDEIDMSGAHWYGGAQVMNNQWPINTYDRPTTAYIAGDSYQDQYGGVQERYFLSSNNAAIFVDNDVPLFVGINHNGNKILELKAEVAAPYKNVNNSRNWLRYRVIHGPDMQKIQSYVAGKFWKCPEGIPDERMLTSPIWSTWAKYKKNINDDVIQSFADEIIANKFSHSQIEIDDEWTPKYGDMQFETTKFPQAKQTIETLKAKGFRVTVWVHPFASLTSQRARKGFTKGYFVKNKGLSIPGISFWWNGVGLILDTTNPEAVEYFTKTMKSLQTDYGVHSFKFDAGEVNWLPRFYSTHIQMANPNEYTTQFAEMAYKCDTTLRLQEVRVGVRTQHLPIVVRMMDKESNWNDNNGLKTLIPHALLFGIIGYPFVLPDMIGGNAYSGMWGIHGTSYPEKELFIRWLQANVFLPCMQFSITPWQYDEETVKIARSMVELHEKFAPTIIRLAKEATQTGAPIVRPLWWIAPDDPTSQEIDSEFLLGNDILSAPILEKGATSRSIYLPPGVWEDELKGGILAGGKWYHNYAVGLHELAYFTRQ